VWFKNLQLYRLDKPWTLPAGELEEKLALRPLLPCSAMSSESRGWVSPRGDEQLVYGVEKHLMLALGTEQKLLPSSVVNDAVKQRAAEFEKEKGFKAGRKQLRDFKDIVSAELLPRAFARRNTTRAWIDPAAQRIIVDSSSPTRAEQLVEQLRDTLGELSVSLPQTEISPGQRLTEWLTARTAPGHFDLGEECELTGTDAAKSIVRYLRHSLDADQIRRHLEEGLKASRLALTWNGRLGLVVNDKLQIKRLKFLEMDEADEGSGSVDAERAFEAEFLLMAGQCGPMIEELLQAFN
jgi:recombination associated protein RdgC